MFLWGDCFMSAANFIAHFVEGPGRRIFAAIIVIAISIAIYTDPLIFTLLGYIFVLPIVCFVFGLYDLIAGDFDLFWEYIYIFFNSLASLGLFISCYFAWRYRTHAWWVEVCCVLAFYLAIYMAWPLVIAELTERGGA